VPREKWLTKGSRSREYRALKVRGEGKCNLESPAKMMPSRDDTQGNQ